MNDSFTKLGSMMQQAAIPPFGDIRGVRIVIDSFKPAASAAVVKDPTCLTQTGSRISTPGQCRGVGRSYSNQDIERTGSTSAGDALALLDSSITVHK